MKVLHLFSGVRGPLIKTVAEGKDPGGGLWGLNGLRRAGVQADIAELEEWFPKPNVANFWRFQVFGVYGAHLPFLPRFFKYDFIYTAGAFTSQFVFTVLKTIFRFKRPIWVMQDFSIIGLLGKEETLRQKIFAWTTARTGGIVTTGKKEIEWLLKRFPNLQGRIEFIPFGTDTTFFSPQLVAEENLIISVGIDPDRDWSTFFKACEGLDARVVLIGSARRLKSFNLPPHVEMMQTIPAVDIRDMYARAKLVVIPLDTSSGVNDAMGCSTLFEAMSMGKAIVASRTHVMESYIDSHNGILVDQKNVEQMRAAIKDLLGNPEKRKVMGEKARAFATAHLDLYKNAEKLKGFLERLSPRT
ncbi:glycosyltransferase family 4 protein [Candidatus Parcubacteria bacterium]|nr:glycosyltransferase family 4 protein [Candidatus Parcubacteria bacterium]